jgi:hypothetical protein
MYLVKTNDYPVNHAPAIYVVRDGRSSIVSYYHYLNKIVQKTTPLMDVICGNVPFGSWSDHYRRWAPATRPDTLLLRYEDLVNSRAHVINTVATYLDVAPNARGEVPDFSKLQKLDSRFFRAGSDDRNIAEIDGNELKVFWLFHGELMERLGYSF